MTRKLLFLLGICLSSLASGQVVAPSNKVVEATEEEERVRGELLDLRNRLAKAFDARDLEALIDGLGSDVFITWQNGTRNNGPKEFREFYHEMVDAENSIVKRVSTTREFDGVPKLYGDSTAVVCGDIKEDFELRDGDKFTLESKWTATLVKTDDRWQVVSYHVSSNVFDNPMLTVAKKYLITFATVGSVLGFLLGALITWFVMHSTRRLADVL